MPGNEDARYDLERLRSAYQETTEAVDGVALIADLANEIDIILKGLPLLMRHGQDHLRDLRAANDAFQRALHYYTTFLHHQASDINGFLGDIAVELPERAESENSDE